MTGGHHQRSSIKTPPGAKKPRRTHKPKKRPIALLRQANLRKTIRVVELAALTTKEVCQKLKVSAEIIRYHRTNARILNLLDAQDRVTAEGKALLEGLDPNSAADFLADLCFEPKLVIAMRGLAARLWSRDVPSIDEFIRVLKTPRNGHSLSKFGSRSFH